MSGSDLYWFLCSLRKWESIQCMKVFIRHTGYLELKGVIILVFPAPGSNWWSSCIFLGLSLDFLLDFVLRPLSFQYRCLVQIYNCAMVTLGATQTLYSPSMNKSFMMSNSYWFTVVSDLMPFCFGSWRPDWILMDGSTFLFVLIIHQCLSLCNQHVPTVGWVSHTFSGLARASSQTFARRYLFQVGRSVTILSLQQPLREWQNVRSPSSFFLWFWGLI